MAIEQRKLEIEISQLSSFHSLSLQSLHCFETISSTNQILWELLEGGKKTPTVAIAAQQTAGRGQWGRIWQSSPGGLYLSVAISPQILVKNAFHLTLFSAWSIAHSLREYNIPIRLKWPNDLILQERKLGGIKTEIRTQGDYINHAVIGVGINWSNIVPNTGITLQSWFEIQEYYSISSLEKLAAIVIVAIFNGYQSYLDQGCDRLLNSYLELLNNLGSSIQVEGIEGTIIGITSQGELRVRLQSQGARTQINLPPGSISLGYQGDNNNNGVDWTK